MLEEAFDFHNKLREKDKSREITGEVEERSCKLEKVDFTLNLSKFFHQKLIMVTNGRFDD